MHFFYLHAAAIASILTPLVCAACWVFYVVYHCEDCPKPETKQLHQLLMIPLVCMVAFDLWIMSFFLAW
jgi:hypothetical protein